MSNKNSKKSQSVIHHEIEGVESASAVTEIAKEIPITFEKQLWRGVKTVFTCTKCGQSRDFADDVIEHILLHYEPSQRVKELERLLKEK